MSELKESPSGKPEATLGSFDWVSWLVVHQMLFVITGVTKTIGNQQMAYLGSDMGWVFLNAALSSIGPAFIPIYVRGIENLYPTKREFRTASIAASLDAVGMVCSVLGMKYAGSGLMSVIYASLPACTAVLRYFWMGKTISRVRLGCMMGVMLGLAIVPLAEGMNFKSDSTLLMFGLATSFAATFFYALLYVSVERSMAAADEKDDTEREAPTDPLRLIFWQAVLAVGLLLAAFAMHHTAYEVPLPQLDASFFYPVVLLLASGASHSYSWVKLIDWSGSTGTGLLQGARSSMSLLASAALFCDAVHRSQCLSFEKIVSAAMVLVGVYLFNRSK